MVGAASSSSKVRVVAVTAPTPREFSAVAVIETSRLSSSLELSNAVIVSVPEVEPAGMTIGDTG